jgi:HSP20 family protein
MITSCLPLQGPDAHDRTWQVRRSFPPVARDGLQREEETMFTKMSMTPWRERFGLRREERVEQHPLDVFYRDFDRLFENFWRGFDLPMAGQYEAPFGAMMPRMDVTEDEDRFRIAVELPGMDEKDVEVVLSDNVLTITGEKRVETKEAEKPYTYMERSYGSFRRSIPLGVEVVTDKIEATFDKGVLTIDLPKTAEAKKAFKKIPVRATGAVKKLEKAA